jgi:hypothetical protein
VVGAWRFEKALARLHNGYRLSFDADADRALRDIDINRAGMMVPLRAILRRRRRPGIRRIDQFDNLQMITRYVRKRCREQLAGCGSRGL